MNEILHLINGNNQPMPKRLPKIRLIAEEINDVALAHIVENTGLHFKKAVFNGYEAQPTTSNQIIRLFLTYNFKTRYFDNWNMENTLCLKFDHHIGFEVDSICFECVKRNHIHTGGLKDSDFLAC